MEWKQNKKTVIAAPRPVAPISLKNSGTALPVFAPDFSNEDYLDSLYDLEAESELQQIFGCSQAMSGMDLLERMDEDRSAFDDYTSSYPFLALGSPGDSPLEFPRLGLSPFPKPENEYPLPSRARNPVTLNTPFERKDQMLEYQAAMTQTLKLALVGMEHQTRTRNRSYSEPIPFYVE